MTETNALVKAKNIENVQTIKPANQKIEYTEEMISELIKCSDDPMYFIRNYMKIQHPTMGSTRFIPYDYQEKIINAYHTHRYNVVLTGRQLGKCFCSNTYIRYNNKTIQIKNLIKTTIKEKIITFLEELLIKLVKNM